MFRKLLDELNRFMYGRYGADGLYWGLLFAFLILSFLSRLFSSVILLALGYALVIWALFRYFSKNIYKRREENRKFKAFWQKIKNYFSYLKDRWKDRKVCRYRKCKYCKAIVRLPIKKGNHSVRCPKCSKSFNVHITF